MSRFRSIRISVDGLGTFVRSAALGGLLFGAALLTLAGPVTAGTVLVGGVLCLVIGRAGLWAWFQR